MVPTNGMFNRPASQFLRMLLCHAICECPLYSSQLREQGGALFLGCPDPVPFASSLSASTPVSVDSSKSWADSSPDEGLTRPRKLCHPWRLFAKALSFLGFCCRSSPPTGCHSSGLGQLFQRCSGPTSNQGPLKIGPSAQHFTLRRSLHSYSAQVCCQMVINHKLF